MQQAGRTGASQDVVTGASSATSTAFGATTYQVRLACTSAVRYRVVEAAGGTALATDTLLIPNWIEYVTVSPGQKIAAIQDSAAGKLNITEMQ